jgi:hypothetical protein
MVAVLKTSIGKSSPKTEEQPASVCPVPGCKETTPDHGSSIEGLKAHLRLSEEELHKFKNEFASLSVTASFMSQPLKFGLPTTMTTFPLPGVPLKTFIPEVGSAVDPEDEVPLPQRSSGFQIKPVHPAVTFKDECRYKNCRIAWSSKHNTTLSNLKAHLKLAEEDFEERKAEFTRISREIRSYELMPKYMQINMYHNKHRCKYQKECKLTSENHDDTAEGLQSHWHIVEASCIDVQE